MRHQYRVECIPSIGFHPQFVQDASKHLGQLGSWKTQGVACMHADGFGSLGQPTCLRTGLGVSKLSSLYSQDQIQRHRLYSPSVSYSCADTVEGNNTNPVRLVLTASFNNILTFYFVFEKIIVQINTAKRRQWHLPKVEK